MSGFLGIWLVRTAPNFLHGEAWALYSGPVRKLFRWIGSLLGPEESDLPSEVQLYLDPRISVRMMRRLIASKLLRPAKGRYVYARLNLPHPPHTVNRACVDTKRHFRCLESACCPTLFMAEFIATLKKLGRFENSLIIFYADHGWDRRNCEAEPEKAIISSARKARMPEFITPKKELDSSSP